MTQLRHVLLLTIEILQLIPLLLFATCIIKAALREEKQASARVYFPESSPKPAPLPDPWLLPLDTTTLFVPSSLPWPTVKKPSNYTALKTANLRKLCSEKGIKWRGVRNGKHLTKTQMVERLTAACA